MIILILIAIAPLSVMGANNPFAARLNTTGKPDADIIYKGFALIEEGKPLAIIQMNGTEFSGKVGDTLNGMEVIRIEATYLILKSNNRLIKLTKTSFNRQRANDDIK